ncbi:MAG TPA: hybrid sensor histidine kinase/response regulator [Pyrinomonadaceae bacterium]|nr:hybrid sensor histidine kinase/response regulator [Pyrinomonadaceae bacterium]
MSDDLSKGKTRVLLVEDDEDDFVITRDLFAEIARDKYVLEWVRDFSSAIDTARCKDYDVCLIDYRLGEKTGLELMHELRSAGYTCPMIILTGQGDREIDEMALGAGAADYLIKGRLDSNDLERSLRYAIQHSRMEKERIAHLAEQEARKLAEEANRAKDEFLAVLSHELRTPLNIMLGWARLLRSIRNNDEVFEKAVDAIERSAVMQTKFVDDLLDVTRIVNGTLKLSKAPLGFSEVVRPPIEAIRPVAEERSLTIRSLIQDHPAKVMVDPIRIQQVVANLLANALKFTPAGGTISVELTVDDNFGHLTIKDTGEGISSEFLPHVFDRYKQAHTSTTNRKGGLGLGLAIVKSIVEMHGGTVRAESEGLGQGAAFSISLPIYDTSPSA